MTGRKKNCDDDENEWESDKGGNERERRECDEVKMTERKKVCDKSESYREKEVCV